MNAPERLWRALEGGDWAAARRQLSLHAEIASPPDPPVPADEYVARHRSAGAPTSVAMIRTATDGNTVALEADVERGARYRVLAFYDLHDARIARGTEVWLRT